MIVQKPEDVTRAIRRSSTTKVPAAVIQHIVDLKKENPGYGVKRISDVLKRFFLIKASPTTVRRTLQDLRVSTPVKKNPAKPPIFERATPTRCGRVIS